MSVSCPGRKVAKDAKKEYKFDGLLAVRVLRGRAFGMHIQVESQRHADSQALRGLRALLLLI